MKALKDWINCKECKPKSGNRILCPKCYVAMMATAGTPIPKWRLIQTFWGYVKKIYENEVYVKIWDKCDDAIELERVFKRSYMRSRKIACKLTDVGQPIQVEVFEDPKGKPRLMVKSLGPARGNKIIRLRNIDYKKFEKLNEQ